MIYTLNTNICPVIDAGLYESNIMAEFDYFNDYVDEEDMIDWDKASVRTEDFKNHLIPYIYDALVGIVSSEINPMFNTVDEFIHVKEIVSYDSPRWYNYDTDTVTFTIDVPDGTIMKLYSKCKDTDFELWLNQFKSCDGFISYSPYNRDLFEKCLRDDPSRAIALMIWYISKDELGGYQERFEDDVRGNTDYLEFIERNEEE